MCNRKRTLFPIESRRTAAYLASKGCPQDNMAFGDANGDVATLVGKAVVSCRSAFVGHVPKRQFVQQVNKWQLTRA